MLTFVAITNRWLSWNHAIRTFQLSDQIAYRAIARAAPHFTHRTLTQWIAVRFPAHWLVGGLAKLLGVSLFVTYEVAQSIVAIAICFVLSELLYRLGVSAAVGALCLGVFILNTYMLRPYLLAPGSIQDLVFVLGATIAVRGLVLRAPASLLGGLLLATLGRQTAPPPACAAAAVILLDPAWRGRLGRSRVPFAAAVVVLPVAVYEVLVLASKGFAAPAPSLVSITLLGGVGSGSVLVQHLGRVIEPLVSVAALLAAASWVGRRYHRTAGGRSEAQPPGTMAAIYACLGFAGAIVLQAVALKPSWATYNEARLAVIGLVPLVIALALVLRELERLSGRGLTRTVAVVLLGLLALGSFHYEYTVIGMADKAQTIVLQVLVAAALAAVMMWWGRRVRTAVANVRSPA
jgi:hypothetical protein